VERLYRGDAATLEAADALDTDVLAAILRQCVARGEGARIEHEGYRRVLGLDAAATSAGEVWRTLADSLTSQIAPHRAALDVILGEGTLASRLLRAVGANPDAAALTKTYRRLCDCLEHGRMFQA
jgi:hypothetical protein